MKKTGAGFTTAGFMFAAATLGSTAAVPGVASAQALTANVSLVSDYRFRGVSQSFRRPAVQGGVDWAHDSGFYVGTWASTVDDDAQDGMREVFRGDGWVHVSGLGISELMTGEGTVLRAAPSDSAKPLKKIGPDDEPKRTRILGCSGKFLKVDADGLIAWTRQYCTNERTTCS